MNHWKETRQEWTLVVGSACRQAIQQIHRGNIQYLFSFFKAVTLKYLKNMPNFASDFGGPKLFRKTHTLWKTLCESFYTNFLLYSLEITENYHLSFLLREKLALLDIIDHNSLTIISALVTFPAYVFFTLLRLTDLFKFT